MRIFQNGGVGRSYLPRLNRLTMGCATFAEVTAEFLADRYGTVHFLDPVLKHDPSTFFTNGDYAHGQKLWAIEQGMKSNASLDAILLAQIEHHRADVFYNLDPMQYGDSFLARLPGCVRRTIAWRAAPSAGGQFLKHDIIVNNFPSLLDGYSRQGVRAEYLSPAYDPEMGAYAAGIERPIDVLFVGGYSQYHHNRAEMLQAIASMRGRSAIAMHLDVSRMVRLAETPLGWIGPLRRERRPVGVRNVSRPPVFGRELLRVLGSAKIVVNGAVDMAGRDRGNMRVWEALGCGAALISDAGNYPEALVENVHYTAYEHALDVVGLIDEMLSEPERLAALAQSGHKTIKTAYSKEKQWHQFQQIAS